jgi:hypothetical protein
MKHSNIADREFDDNDLSTYDLRLTDRFVPPSEDDEYDSYTEAYDWDLDDFDDEEDLNFDDENDDGAFGTDDEDDY